MRSGNVCQSPRLAMLLVLRRLSLPAYARKSALRHLTPVRCFFAPVQAPKFARHSARSLNLLTNESRADQREKLHDETGELAGGQALPFFINDHEPRSPTVRLTAGLLPAGPRRTMPFSGTVHFPVLRTEVEYCKLEWAAMNAH